MDKNDARTALEKPGIELLRPGKADAPANFPVASSRSRFSCDPVRLFSWS